MSTRTVENPKVVSREEWLVARKKLLAKEKQLTRQRDAIAAERRQLPWVKVEKNYAFDSPSGKKTLADLFDGRSQLIVYHFMFGPEWQEGCPSCSFNMDHTDGALVHLAQRDAIAAERRQLPWVKVEKSYGFDSPSGKKTLADLFDGRSQLIVYHFMFGPEWQEGCPSCSFNMDHTDGALVHLAQRDVSFAAVSRAPISKIEAFKKRMGWKFPWVSSYETKFNYDFQASFTPEQLAKGKVEYNYDLVQFPSAEAPGVSVFYKDKDGNIFHTYSAYARGSENTINTYNYLDLVPKGRDEDNLPFTMAWLRHHDRYETGYLADPDRPYWPKAAG